MNDNCARLEPYMSGLLDGELNQQQEQQVTLHLEECAHCRANFMELQQVKHLTREFSRLTQDENQQDLFRRDLTSQSLVWVGWALLAIGCLLMGYSMVLAWVDSHLPLWQKCVTGGFLGGVLLLFIGVLRQQWSARQADKLSKV